MLNSKVFLFVFFSIPLYAQDNLDRSKEVGGTIQIEAESIVASVKQKSFLYLTYLEFGVSPVDNERRQSVCSSMSNGSTVCCNEPKDGHGSVDNWPDAVTAGQLEDAKMHCAALALNEDVYHY
jgi:hypothetical protein